MTRSQRLSFLAIAAVIAVVAVVVLSAGGGGSDEQAATATATPESGGMADATERTPTATATPSATPAPLLQPGRQVRIKVREGEAVRFRVRSPKADEVHLHGYDVEREVGAGQTVTISVPKAQLTGIFSIELHESDEEIGSLQVDPK